MEADIPEVMFEDKAEDLVSDFGYHVKSQGMDLDIYLQYMGMTKESFKESFMDRAKMEVKLRLALEKVAELENFEVSAEEIEAEYKAYCDAFNVKMKEVKARIPEKSIIMDIKVSKASKLVREKAIFS